MDKKMKKKFKHNFIAPPKNLYLHVVRNSAVGLTLVGIALFIGMYGYHVTEHMSWMDAFLNASMILSGMGPAATISTSAGKLFAGCYALFSGLAFISIIVVMLSPFIHKFFRKINVETDDTDD